MESGGADPYIIYFGSEAYFTYFDSEAYLLKTDSEAYLGCNILFFDYLSLSSYFILYLFVGGLYFFFYIWWRRPWLRLKQNWSVIVFQASILSKQVSKRVKRTPLPAPTNIEIAGQIREQPASQGFGTAAPLGLLMDVRVERRTPASQYMLKTTGEMNIVPMRLAARIRKSPQLSPTIFRLIIGQILKQQMTVSAPAPIPHAMAAPIFVAVADTDPQMMPPVIRPKTDHRTMNFPQVRTERARVVSTLALSAKKQLRTFSIQTKFLPSEGVVFFMEKRREVVQKVRKINNAPMSAKIAEKSLCQNYSSLGGFLRKMRAKSPQQLAKRQTAEIKLSSQKR